MEREATPVAGQCDACGTNKAALIKISLGKDFFGRTYDRLSPSSDSSPKWFCSACSLHKNLHRDFRDIQTEAAKWMEGQPSEMTDSQQWERARARLMEIQRHLEQEGGPSPFLAQQDVTALVHRLSAPNPSPAPPDRT